MDGYCILRFIEEHTMISDPQPEQSFEVTAERLNPSCAGLGVAVNRTAGYSEQLSVQWRGSPPQQLAESEAFSTRVIGLVVANLLQCETTSSNHLFERKALVPVLEILT